MKTQWITKGNRDAGSSCSCNRGFHRYLRNFEGGGVLNTPNPPRYATGVVYECSHISEQLTDSDWRRCWSDRNEGLCQLCEKNWKNLVVTHCCCLGAVPSYSSNSADWPDFLHTQPTERVLPSEPLLYPGKPELAVMNMEAVGFFETSARLSITQHSHPTAVRQPINQRPERLRT